MDVRRKKLLYTSIYRGSRETGMLIGSFAKMYLSSMSDQEMDMWEDIVQVEDNFLYRWLVMGRARPHACNNAMGDKLKTFVDNSG